MGEKIHLDRATARRIVKGDERAFRDLFDRFFPRLYRFALARLDGDHDAAAEIVQQTFCRGIDRLDTYRGEAALYTWFCQICRNLIIDHQRRTRRESAKMVQLEDSPHVRAVLEALTAPVQDLPEVGVWQRDVRRLVQATVDALPGHYGEVLEWKYVDGESVKEIAERLGVGLKAAESLLTRARNAFRSAILEMAETSDGLLPPAGTPERGK
ncbi:RNA polymerase sigma factor [Lentisalinibacter salinarum]|uniref:RNA polymerase sigma factor n=1 Tax=Lentisalinibacter salinarum TaxID=2992239 RepID=UPI003866FE95